MREPKRKQGWANSLSIALYQHWAKSFWFRWGAAPIVVGILPSLCIAYYTIPVLKTKLSTFDYFPSVWMDNNGWLVVLMVFIYPTLLISAARFVLSQVNHRSVDQSILFNLMATLDRIVGCKANRFGNHVESLLKEDNSDLKEHPFNEITKPELQIAEIVRGVCELFNSLSTSTGRRKTLIEVVLARVENNKLAAVEIFFPDDEPVRNSIEALNNDQSTMKVALQQKRMVVIESTKKELKKKRNRRYVAGVEDDGNTDWSLICYPIRHQPTNSIPFILSIRSDEPGTFKNEHRELYKLILGRYESRISLEYSLKVIKEEVTKNDTA